MVRSWNWGLLGIAVLLGACGPRPPVNPPVPDSIPTIDPAEVEAVVFLYGDAGEAYMSTSPLLTRLRADVEWWSANLPADSSVVVLNLGDIVYPTGVRPADDPGYAADTAVVMSQVHVAAGPEAVSRGTVQLFTAGNHDWGLEEHWQGLDRLLNLEATLEGARSRLGVAAYLVPPPGSGGPYVRDVGQYFRVILLESAWWTHLADEAAEQQVIAAVDSVLAETGDRSVLIAAHHPFKSAGAHGGEFDFWQTLGLRYVLNRSGAVLQDLTSIPFRTFERGLRRVFESHDPPLLFAGGHDHSLQVLAGTEPTDPVFMLVAGSASKLSAVGRRDGVLYGAEVPGYMRLVIERDGDATLFVEATAPEYLACPTTEAERVACINEGVAAFRTVYAREVR